MNKVILIGNLTKDPELTTTNSGISVCRFSLAVSRRFPGPTGERETDFFNIVVWRGQAENCHKFLRKGNKCAIVGTIQNHSYDAQDGSKRYVTEITAEEVEFLNSKPSDSSDYKTPEKDVSDLEEVDGDDLPF